MFKRICNLGMISLLLFSSVLQAYGVADISTNSNAWARNKVTNTDINTSGASVDTSFALASDNDKIEISIMVRNTGDAASGTIDLWRTGDLDGTYIAGSLKKSALGDAGVYTTLTVGDWTNFNASGTKLSLGTIPASSYVRVVYQIDIGGSHVYGDILQDYIKIYDTAALIKTLSVSTYVPYLKIQNANSGDDSIVLNSAIDLLKTSAETIGNFEVSSNNGGSFTTLAGPSTAVYSNAGRTITLTQSQVDFDSGDNIVVRLSGVKTADDLRFLSPSNFTTNFSSVSTVAVVAVDTTAPTFTAGFDAIAGSKGTLLLTFDEPMNTSTISSANVLARTSFNGHDLGTSPTISWTSTSTIKIVLDNDGDVVVGDTVTLNSSVTDVNSNAVDGSAVTISTVVLNAPTSSSSSSGGGGSAVNTTTIYNLPLLPSESAVRSYRPIKVSGSVFTRPVKQTNYYTDAVTEIPFETEVFDLEGKTLTGSVIYPVDRVKADDVKIDLRIPNPPKPLVYGRYYQFGSLNEQFSKEIDISIPVASSVLKLEPTEFNIYKWVPSMGDSLVSSGGLVYRAGEWVNMGDGTIIDETGILSFSIKHSTLIAFTTADEGAVDDDEEEIVDEESLTPFTDIVGHWAEQFIENLYLKGVINGTTETTFDPNANLTRAELTKIALKSFGFEIPENVTEKPFSDVALNTWYLGFVTKAKELGVLDGYADGTFRPNQPVNRSEALKILIEAAGIDANGYEATFLDTDSEAWYVPYIAYAKQKGIVEGYAAQVAMPKVMSGSQIASVSEVYDFKRYLGKGDTGEDVKDLQKTLVLLGYFKGELTGEFDEATAEALMQFQLVSNIITSEKSVGAGYLGPLTLEMLLKEKIENQVEFETQTQYYFKPGQFITRAEIAKIAVSLIED